MKYLVRAVLFDLDGVVVFTDKYHYLAWKQLADEQGWDFNEEINHGCRGVPRMASLEVILHHNGVELPQDEKEVLADRKNGYYKKLLEEINESDLYPGVIPFIQALRAKGIRIGLCSSSKNAALVLDKLSLTHLFDTVVTGHDFTNAKPDPEIFLLGAEKLRVPYFHCLVFEDAYSGVEAALAARMKCVGVGTRKVLPNAPEVIQRYDEIDLETLLRAGRKSPIACDPWSVFESGISPRRAQHWESVFTVTNGFLGMRGAHEEEDDAWGNLSEPGFFLNGIYEYEPYHHVVSFPGFPPHTHHMLNFCDFRIINLVVEGEPFSFFSGEVTDYQRELDLETGLVIRSIVWESPKGHRVRIVSRRLASMVRRHSVAMRYEVTPLEGDLNITLESVVRGWADSKSLGSGKYTRIEAQDTRGDVRYFHAQTTTSGFDVGMAFAHATAGELVADPQLEVSSGVFREQFRFHAGKDQTVRLDKHACFYTSVETPADRVVTEAIASVRADAGEGFHVLESEQAAFWKEFWTEGDFEVDGHIPDQMALRFCIYQLRQNHPQDDHRSISACGMTGEHYGGHVFWDTEMYLAPYYAYTEPGLQRPLLMYRYHILDRARERAAQMHGKGALYSWNSISGEECGVIFEAATAEYHLVSAIAYAIHRYIATTGDEDFLHRYGAEMLFETARFLEDRGCYVETKGDQFCINVVCGPDEYGCGVNNNCYTNVMAQWHLRYAAEVYDQMARNCPKDLTSLSERIGLSEEEVRAWREAADRMYIPYDAQRGIHMQDDSFLYLDPVDMALVPLHHDLRAINHPLNLWRMQVAKQADVVLLMLAQSHQFTLEQKRANYMFYEPRTNHASSLSPSIHSIIASEIGEHERAYDYFHFSAFMDLSDVKENTNGGLHAACLGGTWMAAVFGFAGMRDEPDGLHFRPVLPREWDGYRFKVHYRGRTIGLDVNGQRSRFTLLEGESIEFTVGSDTLMLTRDKLTAETATVLPE